MMADFPNGSYDDDTAINGEDLGIVSDQIEGCVAHTVQQLKETGSKQGISENKQGTSPHIINTGSSQMYVEPKTESTNNWKLGYLPHSCYRIGRRPKRVHLA